MQLDSAVGMWQLLFSDERAWPLIHEWCSFLQKHHNRAISKDTWAQLLDFSKVRMLPVSELIQSYVYVHWLISVIWHSLECGNEYVAML